MKQEFTISVDNTRANTHNININRPSFSVFAESKEEAVGKMILSDFPHKHKRILDIRNEQGETVWECPNHKQEMANAWEHITAIIKKRNENKTVEKA
jgi:hypothetical protein